MSSSESVLRVGFFLDGYTLKKVNEYYSKYHRFHARLDFRELKQWVRDYVAKLFHKEGTPVELESHYYHPYARFTDVAEAPGDVKMDRFEKQLVRAGFEFHYNLPEKVPGLKGDGTVVLEKADEVKVVFLGQDVEKWAAFPAQAHFLQPCSCENTEETMNHILRHPQWRLSLQTHKLLNIR